MNNNLPNSKFDPISVLGVIRQNKRKSTPVKRKVSSKIEKFHGEVMQLRNAGGTYEEITAFLKSKSIDVHYTSILRYIKKHGQIIQLS